ncbi:MAG: M42 family metallopeptidase [Christensenellales bacterium]
MNFLSELTKLSGVSGFEDEVRSYIVDQCKKLADEVTVDKLGNVIALCRSTHPNAKRIMVAAHMDEVGLIVTGIDDNGFLHFLPVGGIDARVLISKRLHIGRNKVPGVIGVRAIHLLEAEEMDAPVKVDQLRIDIGAKDKEDAEKLVQPGDTAIFATEFGYYGDGLVKARALDDRSGCGMLLHAMEKRYPIELAAVFTAQEEIGARGAFVAARQLNPDAAIVLEGTTCADIAGVDDTQKVTRIGKGPVIGVMDQSAVHHIGLRSYLWKTAQKVGIEPQNREGTFGGTDSGAIQRSGTGIPVAMIAIATRFIHSPVTAISRSDYEAGCLLLQEALTNMQNFFAQKEA